MLTGPCNKNKINNQLINLIQKRPKMGPKWGQKVSCEKVPFLDPFFGLFSESGLYGKGIVKKGVQKWVHVLSQKWIFGEIGKKPCKK